MKATAALSIVAVAAALGAAPAMALDANANLGVNAGVNVSAGDDASVNADVGANAGVNASTDDDSASTGVKASTDANASANDSGDDTSVNASVGANADINAGTDDDAGAAIDTNGDANATSGEQTAEGGGDVSLDALLKLINDNDYSDSTFSVWSSASSTTVVNTDDLFDADSQAKIDAAVKANWSEHEDLDAAINANADLKAWLDAHDIRADSVIAIETKADGSVNVYEG